MMDLGYTSIRMNFVADFDWAEGVFTLASLGATGRVHVETFNSYPALDYKVRVLEGHGFTVEVMPVGIVVLHRTSMEGRWPGGYKLNEVKAVYNPTNNINSPSPSLFQGECLSIVATARFKGGITAE